LKKCEQYTESKRQEFAMIKALKGKSESFHHAMLKCHAVNFLRAIGIENIETEFTIEDIGIIDVMGFDDGVSIAIECGNTSPEKIFALEKLCNIVIHIPYCYTPKFFECNYDEIQHKLMVHAIAKRLREEGIEFTIGKRYCLEGCEGCDGSKLDEVLGAVKGAQQNDS